MRTRALWTMAAGSFLWAACGGREVSLGGPAGGGFTETGGDQTSGSVSGGSNGDSASGSGAASSATGADTSVSGSASGTSGSTTGTSSGVTTTATATGTATGFTTGTATGVTTGTATGFTTSTGAGSATGAGSGPSTGAGSATGTATGFTTGTSTGGMCDAMVAPLSDTEAASLQHNAIYIRKGDLDALIEKNVAGATTTGGGTGGTSGTGGAAGSDPDRIVLVIGNPVPTCDDPFPVPTCGTSMSAQIELPASAASPGAFGGSDVMLRSSDTTTDCSGAGTVGGGTGGAPFTCDPSNRVEIIEFTPASSQEAPVVDDVFFRVRGANPLPQVPIDGAYGAPVCPVTSPCQGKVCGQSCSLCAPGQVCPPATTTCDAKGACTIAGSATCPTGCSLVGAWHTQAAPWNGLSAQSITTFGSNGTFTGYGLNADGTPEAAGAFNGRWSFDQSTLSISDTTGADMTCQYPAAWAVSFSADCQVAQLGLSFDDCTGARRFFDGTVTLTRN